MAVDRAFDVEAVTRRFFEDYKRVFDGVMATVMGFGQSKEEQEAKKLFVQTLFNRLMFIYFLSRKGWLKFKGDPDYLNALRKDYAAGPAENNFYDIRLKLLFFAGLNNDASRDVRSPILASLIGNVPFLNGGLFEETKEDKRTNVVVPDDAIDQILRQLFDRFNFTVMESTPFDVEVAVDPEMLGKVFEELVTGRHESGSYYTPRPVVSFMCREALKGYLETQNTGASTEAIAAFVDHKDTSDLTLSSAPKLGEALARVKVVDPACGSGAYLLGMMQELVELMAVLYSAQLSHEAQDLYNLKLRIIEQNLYGADIDQFAVNIAMLRLWLSLAIDYDGPVPPPLPNLDFKIVCGDSLLGPDPSPENYGTLFRHRIHLLAGQLADLKARHMGATGQEKTNLTKEIEGLKAKLREALADSAAPKDAVDWRVEFAEVFDQNGGFHVAIANPPYGAQGTIGVRDLYFDRRIEGNQSNDSYGLFIARGLELLHPNGQLTYIVSDTWRTIRSHRPLRARLFKTTTVKHIIDLPSWIFRATVNTCILNLSKTQPSERHMIAASDLRGLPTGNWQRLSYYLTDVVSSQDVQTDSWARYSYRQGIIATHRSLPFFIASPQLYELFFGPGMTRLGDVGEAVHGISTGDNKQYVRAEAGARGGYPLIEEWMKMPPDRMARLTDVEKVRGVQQDLDGLRGCFVPFDKGGVSEASSGWLPNYYVKTPYYINWSSGAIRDMRRNIGARWINERYFFEQGLTFSISGIYAPTFRLNSGAIFEAKGSGIFCNNLSPYVLLGLLCSRVARYFFKSFIKHSVDTSGDDINEFRFPLPDAETTARIESLVKSIVEKQKADPAYPYHQHQQKELDRCVYRLYRLNQEHIREIECWFLRRYPTLARAQGISLT
ncbi:MAG: N-6 DNA methylase [Chloroflexi bacterium]|nr:N-6 DNA methylase [Chloroflexota bacterium]